MTCFQRRERAPPFVTRTRRRHLAQLGEDVEVVPEPERDALEDRAEQVAARRCASDEPDERAARVGVVDGRLLAEQVGQRDDAAAPPGRTLRASASSARERRAARDPRWNQRMKLPDVAMQPFGRYRPGRRWKSR